MNLGVSPITNKLFVGKSKDCGNGIREWTGKKYDVTDGAIRAVFEWFMNNHKSNMPNEAYEIRYENCPYVLAMTKEKEQ